MSDLEPTLRFSFLARPDALAGMRAELDGWLAELELSPDVRADLVVAANEAGANAVEHAYRDGRTGDVTIEGDVGDEIVIRVIDHGSWRFGDGDPNRGRGMHIMRSLVEDIEVLSNEDGTTVILRRSLPRRAR
jgi:anti-sigma regulatory factor (Ser/Thr protein kinase)